MAVFPDAPNKGKASFPVEPIKCVHLLTPPRQKPSIRKRADEWETFCMLFTGIAFAEFDEEPAEIVWFWREGGDIQLPEDSYGDKTTELRADGVIIPLDEYITPERVPHMFESVKEFAAALELMRRDDGQIWAIPATFASLAGPTPWIRYDWLENLGLDVPETFEDPKDVLIAFTNDDPDGNGEDNTWGTSYGGIYNGISTNLGSGWAT